MSGLDAVNGGDRAELPPPVSAAALRRDIADRLSAPSIALAITFGLNAAFLVVALGMTLFSELTTAPSGPSDGSGMPLLLAGYLGCILYQAAGLYGAVCMRNMRSHAWSVAAVVLALLPCVSILYPLGLAFGIWAATVMFGRAAPYAFRGEQPPPGITARGSGSAGLLIGLGAAAVVVVPMMGVMAALAIYGVRRYVYAAKTAEAREGVMALAHGVVRCAEARGGVLPESGEAVPPDAASVRGGKYQSAPEDWSSEPFACAGFSRTAPQYYQFRWIASSSELGHAEARGDLDADGNTSVFRVQVSCADGRCTADPVVIEQDPLE